MILAAGVLKLPDLAGPLGAGIRGQVLAGSIVSGLAAYASVRRADGGVGAVATAGRSVDLTERSG